MLSSHYGILLGFSLGCVFTGCTIAVISSALSWAILKEINSLEQRPRHFKNSPIEEKSSKNVEIHNPSKLQIPLTDGQYSDLTPIAEVNSSNSKDSWEKIEDIEPETLKVDPFCPQKRQNYLSWDDYFMAVAFLSAQRSKDPNRQVGACIVGENKVILGIGYNGFPRGVHDDNLPWSKKSIDGNPLKTKYPYVCHAEVNAILNRNDASALNQRMYVTMFPCNECAKLIIQAGITEVIYFTDKGNSIEVINSSQSKDLSYGASKKLLALANVKVWQHSSQKKGVVLEFK